MSTVPLNRDSSIELFEMLVEFAPDALLVVDAAGTVVFANRMADALFGYAREELIGTGIDRLVPERLRQPHARHRADFMKGPRTREMGAELADLVAERRDGSEFPVEIRLAPVAVAGQGVLIAAAVRDVTDRRHAARVLRGAQVEAERASAAKTRFLATASHDLRQPLQTLQLLNAALQEQVSDPSARELLSREREALDGMSQLLNALLDISRLETGNLQPSLEDVSLADVFDALRRDFAAVARARGLDLEIADADQYLRTDRTLFRQLLENLIGNAIKYTDAGRVRVGCERDAAGLAITVADTGIGIAADKIGSIFDEYYRVGRTGRRGVGLGLSIVRRIARLLSLSIEVSSEPGVGTTFRVGIPRDQLVQVAPLRREAATARLPDTPEGGAVIVLVEDDDAVRGATELYLRAIGHEPIGAATIAEAERAVRAAERPPDLIISDYHLGKGQTGVEAIDRLRRSLGRELPALLLSGDTSTAMQRLARLPACRVLNKPVDVGQLSHAIHDLLEARRPLDAAAP